MKFSMSLKSFKEIIDRLKNVADSNAFENRFHYVDVIAQNGELSVLAANKGNYGEIKTRMFHADADGEFSIRWIDINQALAVLYHTSQNKDYDIVDVALQKERDRVVFSVGNVVEYMPCYVEHKHFHNGIEWFSNGATSLTMSIDRFKRLKSVFRAAKVRKYSYDGYVWKNVVNIRRLNNIVSIEASDTTRYHLMRYYDEGPDVSLLLFPDTYSQALDIFKDGDYVKFEKIDGNAVYIITCGDASMTTFQRGLEYPDFSDIAKPRQTSIIVNTAKLRNSLMTAKRTVGENNGGVDIRFADNYLIIRPYTFEYIDGRTFDKTRKYETASTIVFGNDCVNPGQTKSYPVQHVLDMVQTGSKYAHVSIDEKGILYVSAENFFGMVYPYIS